MGDDKLTPQQQDEDAERSAAPPKQNENPYTARTTAAWFFTQRRRKKAPAYQPSLPEDFCRPVSLIAGFAAAVFFCVGVPFFALSIFEWPTWTVGPGVLDVMSRGEKVGQYIEVVVVFAIGAAFTWLAWRVTYSLADAYIGPRVAREHRAEAAKLLETLRRLRRHGEDV